MIYTEMTKKAIRLMFDLHKEQTDKSGLPYVFHPWHVAESMDDEITATVALLHDAVEDTDLTLEDVRDILRVKCEMGFAADIKQMILDLGAKSLKDVNPDDYEPLVKAVQALGTGGDDDA